MKRFVNGEAVEFPDEPIDIRDGGDRLYVKTEQGVFSAVAVRQGERTLVSFRGRQFEVERKLPRTRSHHAAGGEIRGPMPGQIVEVFVSEGDAVTKGQKLLVLEAMKTQQPFTAPFDGVVSRLSVSKGEQIEEGTLLALIEETP